jgi:hypothetical protein
MTALLLWTFVLTFVNVLRDLVPAVTLCVLLCVPPSAVVVFCFGSYALHDPSRSRFSGYWAAGRFRVG